MSAENEVRPYHARPESSGQETADAVAAVLRHAQAKDTAAGAKVAPKQQPRWMLPLGVNLAVFAVYMLIAPPDWTTLNPIEVPSLAKQEQDLQTFIHLTAFRIEAFRAQNGAYPTNFEELGGGPLPDGVDYVSEGRSFRLIGSVGEEPLVYDSAAPDPVFAQSAETKLAEIGG